MNNTYEQLKKVETGFDAFESGLRYYTEEAQIYSSGEWKIIEDICSCDSLVWEHIDIGDAGEPNCVEVTRFMTDVQYPKIINARYSYKLLSTLINDRVREECAEIVGTSELYVRRCQVNLMREDSFIGLHLDVDSNPDYAVSVVLQLGKSFEGGEMAVADGQVAFKPAYRSTLITKSCIPHEVKKVKRGSRLSLVFFLSKNNGANRRIES